MMSRPRLRATAALVVGLAAIAAFAACDAASSASSRGPAVDPRTEPEPLPLPPPTVEPETSLGAGAARRVVFLTVDGVRWEDAFGEDPDAAADGAAPMANLHRLTSERGVALGRPDCPHEVSASGPNFVSLPGYLEMFTGKPTACTHNYCPPVEETTFVDEARAAHPQLGDVAVFASWSRLGTVVAKHRRSIVISAGAYGGAIPAAKEDARLRSLIEDGAARPGYPGSGDYRADVHTARIALRYLEVARPHVLVIGLGDADEHAHRGDIAGYRRAIKRSDEIIGELARTLDRMDAAGRETAVIVTTDHGRQKTLWNHGGTWPESKRVFFAAFGAGIARRGAACSAGPLRLAHLAGAMRAVMALERDEDPGPLAAEILATR